MPVNEPLSRQVVLALFIAFIACGADAAAPNPDVYKGAIDIRWPSDTRITARDGFARVITILVIPGQSVDAETYLVLRARPDGSVDARYEEPDGQSLYAQIRSRIASGSTSEDEIAHGLKVRSFMLPNDRRIRDLMRDLTRLRLHTSLPDALYLDGTRYDIAEVTLMNSLSLSMFDSDVVPRNELLTWAKKAVRVCRTIAHAK